MFKRIIIDANENAKNMVFDHSCGNPVAIHRTSSVVDEFYFERVFCEDGSECVACVDPIVVLFNQERLVGLGETGAKAFLDSFQQRTDSLAELRKNCSDEDLISMMKSRYLQTPSEIVAWCRYMESNIDKFNSEVQSMIQANQEELDKSTVVEPPKSE